MSIIKNGKIIAGSYNIGTASDATTDKKGIIRIATNQEALDGTLENVAITPKQLSQYGGNNSNTLVDGTTIVKNEDTDIITTVGVLTKNDRFVFDWIGTKQEYETAIANGDIPENENWVCWITDDNQDLGLPPATVDTLGFVKPDGTTTTVDAEGVLSAILPKEYVLPTASTDTLGGVKVDGSTISIVDGVISSLVQGGDEWEYSKGTNSYIKHKTSGLIIQSGSVTFTGSGTTGTTSSKTITLPKAFTSTKYSVVCFGLNDWFPASIGGANYISSRSTTNFTVTNITTSSSISASFSWIAFGY